MKARVVLRGGLCTLLAVAGTAPEAAHYGGCEQRYLPGQEGRESRQLGFHLCPARYRRGGCERRTPHGELDRRGERHGRGFRARPVVQWFLGSDARRHSTETGGARYSLREYGLRHRPARPLTACALGVPYPCGIVMLLLETWVHPEHS